MAMMMTGRVLLVCALCVLWCVVGGRCDEVVVGSAGGAVDESEPLVQSPELGTSSKGSKELKDGAPVVKRESTPTPSDGEDDDDDGKGEGDGQEDGSPSELEENVEDGPGKQKTKPEIQNKEQEVRQPPQAQVNVLQQPPPPPAELPTPDTCGKVISDFLVSSFPEAPIAGGGGSSESSLPSSSSFESLSSFFFPASSSPTTSPLARDGDAFP
ncbi:hypothetical protein TcBrA4_0021890 [Trypanosoma cruzi]|nr:hypothetical protein TcBrA4_0021890 [Trypanosoma cruzi]